MSNEKKMTLQEAIDKLQVLAETTMCKEESQEYAEIVDTLIDARNARDEMIKTLNLIFIDADMAISGEWDKGDEGFDDQLSLIEDLFDKYGFELKPISKES